MSLTVQDVSRAKYSADPASALSVLAQQLLARDYVEAHHPDHTCYLLQTIVESAGSAHLEAMPCMIKAQMLRQLSRYINGPRSTLSLKQAAIHAGQQLCLTTAVPEEMVLKLSNCENRLMDRLAEVVVAEKDDPQSIFKQDGLINVERLRNFSHQFLDAFAESYNMKCGIALESDGKLPSKNDFKALGRSYWDYAQDKPAVEIDHSRYIKSDEVVWLVGILGHECGHAFVYHVHNTHINVEFHKEKKPWLYVLRAVTDHTFYDTSDRDVYTNHPEEIFVQRMGLRIATRFADLMDVVLNAEAMQRIASDGFDTFKSPKLVDDLSGLFNQHGEPFPADKLPDNDPRKCWRSYAASLMADTNNCRRRMGS